MTDQEINIAIAEACGWSNIIELDDIYPDESVAAGFWWQGVTPASSEISGEQLIPDYCNDLNAMHEAEVSCIIPMKTPCFYDTLQSIIFRDKEMTDENPKIFSAWLTHANARQRAEAFVRTLGLWED